MDYKTVVMVDTLHIQDALQHLEMAITMVDAAKKSDDPEVILERAITRLDILRGFLLKNEF